MERKEAIEIVRKLYNESLFLKKDKEAMVTLIPELKESEGESIRKRLIELLKKNDEQHFAKEIAWLEKQGEQKPVIEMKTPEESLGIDSETYNKIVDECVYGEQKPKFRIGDTIKKKSTSDIVTICEIDLKNREYRLSNTGFIPFKYEHLWELVEQNSTNKIEPKFHEGDIIKLKDTNETFEVSKIEIFDADEIYYHLTNGGCVGENADNFERVEQKAVEENKGNNGGISPNSTWSEEDETIKNNISHIIRQYDKISKRENQPCYYVGDCLLWIQNIKDRVQPQSKQEWSEEDESHIRYLIECLEHCKKGVSLTMTASTAQEYINWLKSLRPQKQWKPSDEQLEAIRLARTFVTDDFGENPTLSEILIELEEQLKKLK